MKIVVGSKNAAKVNAVADILHDYPHLREAEVEGIEVDSGISSQPKTLEETVRGARNRAKAAFDGCDYSVGIESGLVEVPYSKSGYMDVCVAAIYDGGEYHLGLSSAWEFKDSSIFREIVDGTEEMTDVLVRRGLFADQSERAANGAIHYATGGRLNRKNFTQEAIRSALIHLEPEL